MASSHADWMDFFFLQIFPQLQVNLDLDFDWAMKRHDYGLIILL